MSHEQPPQNKHEMAPGRVSVSEILERENRDSSEGRHAKKAYSFEDEYNKTLEAIKKVEDRHDPANARFQEEMDSFDDTFKKFGISAENHNGKHRTHDVADHKPQETPAPSSASTEQEPPRIATPEDVARFKGEELDIQEADEAALDLAGPESSDTPNDDKEVDAPSGEPRNLKELQAAVAKKLAEEEQQNGSENEIASAIDDAAKEAERRKAEVFDEQHALEAFADVYHELLERSDGSGSDSPEQGDDNELERLRAENESLKEENSALLAAIEKFKNNKEKANKRKAGRLSFKSSFMGEKSLSEKAKRLNPAGFFGKLLSKLRRNKDVAPEESAENEPGDSHEVEYSDGATGLVYDTPDSEITLGAGSKLKYGRNFSKHGQDLILIRGKDKNGKDVVVGLHKGYVFDSITNQAFDLDGNDTITVTTGKFNRIPGLKDKIGVSSVELRYKTNSDTTSDKPSPYEFYFNAVEKLNKENNDNE